MGVIAGFVILSFYGVVAGWSFGYIFEAMKGSFYDFSEPVSSAEHFGSLTSNVTWIVGFLAVFMGLTMFIVYAGVQKGIERGVKNYDAVLLLFF